MELCSLLSDRVNEYSIALDVKIIPNAEQVHSFVYTPSSVINNIEVHLHLFMIQYYCTVYEIFITLLYIAFVCHLSMQVQYIRVHFTQCHALHSLCPVP